MTSKGNGSLNIGNLHLKGYDAQNDRYVMFRTVFADADGCRDLLVSGRVLNFDEKSDDVTNTENVLFVFHFDSKSKETYRGATFRINLRQ